MLPQCFIFSFFYDERYLLFAKGHKSIECACDKNQATAQVGRDPAA